MKYHHFQQKTTILNYVILTHDNTDKHYTITHFGKSTPKDYDATPSI